MAIDDIHHLLNSWHVPRRSMNGHVYELHKDSWLPVVRTIRLRERQVEILRLVRALPWEAYLNYERSPAGSAVARDYHTWLIPRDQNSGQLLQEHLSPGGWSMYLTSSPLAGVTIPWIFDMSSESICEFIRGHGMPVLLQARPGNSEWRIAVEPAVVPMVAVA